MREFFSGLWACSFLGVVVFGVRRDFIGGKGKLLVVVHGLERGNIHTCGHGTGGVREKECEDECSGDTA